ncbi:hypothetical protein Pelo_9180 [Pelomyxa schiedti]|nr:hypothetical protein Pelo_9180 [Pelomyxa schiedti]
MSGTTNHQITIVSCAVGRGLDPDALGTSLGPGFSVSAVPLSLLYSAIVGPTAATATSASANADQHVLLRAVSMSSSVVVVDLGPPLHQNPPVSSFVHGFLLSRRRPSTVVHFHPQTHDGPDDYDCGGDPSGAKLGADRRSCCSLPSCTSGIEACAAACRAAVSENEADLDVKQGSYRSLMIRPRGCDPSFLDRTLRNSICEHTSGAIYVWVPVVSQSCSHYLEVAVRYGLKPWLATPKYLIYYKWNKIGKDMVPSAATSIAGAQAVLLSPDKSKVLMTKEIRVNDPVYPYYDKSRPPTEHTWRFPGGAVDFGESDAESVIRELQEELGIAVPLEGLHLVNTYNMKKARAWGVFDPGDEPLYVNDHLQVFVAFLDPSVPLQPEEAEIINAQWFPISEVLSGTLPGASARTTYRLKEALDHIERNNIHP